MSQLDCEGSWGQDWYFACRASPCHPQPLAGHAPMVNVMCVDCQGQQGAPGLAGYGFSFSSCPWQAVWPELAGVVLPTRWWLLTRCPTCSTCTSSWGARSSSLEPRRCLLVRGGCVATGLFILGQCWSLWSCGGPSHIGVLGAVIHAVCGRC